MPAPDAPRKPRPYPHGTYTMIARRLGITKQSVRDVALGIKKSERVRVELAKVTRNEKRRAARVQSEPNAEMARPSDDAGR